MICGHAGMQGAEPIDGVDASALPLEPHHEHRHHAAVFLGGATRLGGHEQRESGMTIGVDYDYRILPHWGVGAGIEGVFLHDHHRDLAVTATVSWYPVGGLRIAAGPGVETGGEHTLLVVRTAVSYAFKVGAFTIGPEVAVDFTEEGETLVYGVSVGRGF